MLGFLAAIFYAGAALAALAAVLLAASHKGALLPMDLGALVSCLFFAAMCQAMGRIIELLVEIAQRLRPRDSAEPGKLSEAERAERMSRVAKWVD